MKVAIFYDSPRRQDVQKIKDTISSHDCVVSLYSDDLVKELQESEVSPYELMKDVTHALFVYEKDSLKQVAFIFFAGYALGAGLPMLMVCEASDVALPKVWLNLFTMLSLECLDSYFADEVRRFGENKAREIAKSKLLELGYSVFDANYAQAVKNNEVGAVKLFIEAGFSPSALDAAGTPMLSLAVRERHADMVSLLLEEGANVNATSRDRGYTALMDAAQIGEVKIAQLLLAQSADPNTQGKDGQTALILAVGRQDVDVIISLLENGGDCNIKDSMGMSALDYVKLFHNEKILALFEDEVAS